MPIDRRTFGMGALGLAATLPIAAIGPLAAPAAADDGAGDPVARATRAYQGMQRYLYQPSPQLYFEQYPYIGGNQYSYVWPFSQATVATLDLSALSGVGAGYAADVQTRFTALEDYFNAAPVSHNPPSPPAASSPPGYASYLPPPRGHGGDLFYDDNDWVALSFIQRHYLTGDQSALQKAKDLYRLVIYAWDTDASHADPGGDYWTQAPWSHDRNTISNAPGAELGLHLAAITGDKSYIAEAKQRFDWVNANLLAPNGLYWDHVDLQGNINKTQWSYNQGVMLGASALLYKATGDKTYLDRAQQIARTALDYYGAGGRIFTQDVIFNAIFFKNLLLLHAIHPVAGVREALQRYADTLWGAVDPATGLLQKQAYSVPLLDQAGLVQLNALLAMRPEQYKLLA